MKLAIRRASSLRFSGWIIVSLILISLFVTSTFLIKIQKNSLYASYQGCSKNYEDSLRLCWNANGKVVDLFQNGGLVIHKKFSGEDPKETQRTEKK